MMIGVIEKETANCLAKRARVEVNAGNATRGEGGEWTSSFTEMTKIIEIS